MCNSNLIGCHVFIFAKSGNPGIAGKNTNPVRCALLLSLNQQAVDSESGLTGNLLGTSENPWQGAVENTRYILKTS